MNRFTLSRPTSVEETIGGAIAGDAARIIAGGTNLIDLMRANVERPEHLIDITKLALDRIEAMPDRGLRLGALVKNADTAYNDKVQSRYPLLAKAILAGASPQLRNMATNGGNLLQRTRCYYFYDTATACNKREPGQGCAALHGINRIHAILGASENCVAVHPSDMCVALAALAANVRVVGKDGERTIPFSAFHRLPGDTPHIDANLQHSELITAIELPANNFHQHYQYLKIRDRRSYAFALVSVAAALELEGDAIKDVRLALGGVAHKPWRDQEAESFLKGKTADVSNFASVAEIIMRDAKPLTHNAFKIELAKRAIIRALTEARDLQAPEPLNCYTYNRHRLQ
jgi:xanthine dehydrogenase YagS FAD-binding subunit